MSEFNLLTNNASMELFCGIIGQMPNIEMPTAGGHYCWNNLKEVNGWKIQQNIFTSHCRILDPRDYRKAWGSKKEMLECYGRFVKECCRELEAGDIIAVDRIPLYQHFGVYIGNGRVIHFASINGDFGGNTTIHEAPFSEFLRDSEKFYILEFDDRRSEPLQFKGIISTIAGSSVSAHSARGFININNALTEREKNEQYHLYSPEETVRRAKELCNSNKESYNLIFNNCEHFAIWCKTGVSESYQVEKVLDIIKTIGHIGDVGRI